MKKLVLFALILTLGAQVAGAVTPPLANTWYRCDYQTGGHFNEKDPGFSIFKISGAPTLLRGIEDYEATTSTGWDNRKVTFANPVNIRVWDPDLRQWVVIGSKYEFTINPGGPQCTNTQVLDDGHLIAFLGCSDGVVRYCSTY